MRALNAESAPRHPSVETEFVSRVCVPFLQSAQNDDGGWGFHPGSQSRVEPTCWALLALAEQQQTTANSQREKGIDFVRGGQLSDGSFAACAGQNVGCWVTSLASWALLRDPESKKAVEAGLRWVCEDWPRDINLLRRIVRKLKPGQQVSRQNNSLRGWGWTPRTASWVEPTALALIALEQAPEELRPGGCEKRCRMAKLMIYDRMCPGGGWNCGNPMVYGVPGDPAVGQTVWALLALRNEPDTEQKRLSLQWLEENLGVVSGAASIALAKICLEVYGRPWTDGASRLAEALEKRELTISVTVMALACLALGGWGRLLKTSEVL
jgi:hypothetical protein